MLSRLTAKNFRLLRSVELDFEPGRPLVLIGPNSSGKTTVLALLDFLRRAATEGLAAADAMGGIATKGVIEDVEITIESDPTRWGYKPLDAPGLCQHLSYSLSLSRHDPAQVTTESLRSLSAQSPPAEVAHRDKKGTWVLNAFMKKRDDLSRLATTGLLMQTVKQNIFYPELSELEKFLSLIRVYGEFLTTPAWNRDPRESAVSPADSAMLTPTPTLSRRGLDLVNALFHIQNENQAGWEELLDAFRAEFPFVSRLEFPADPSGGKIGLGWRDKRYPSERMSGYQMSEGMLAYLCLLAAIFSVNPPSVLGFDEPDLHLHPSALRRLVHLLERKSLKTPVIIATHSDRLLDYLSDPAGSIRVCQPTRDGVEIQPIDRAALEEWRRTYTLSELRDRGHIDPSNEDTTRLDA